MYEYVNMPPKSVGYFVVVVFRRAPLTVAPAGIEPQQPWGY